MNRKTHQRAINRAVRAFNKRLEQDDLWLGRFIVRQYESSPQWRKYADGSNEELWVKLKFIDRATGRYYVGNHTVNQWCNFNGSRIWHIMNWLITEHWDVWKEGLAQEHNFDAWREYNAKERVC
jgi:hypothetical protein